MNNKKTLKEFVSNLDHWISWENNYKKYVPQFINEASKRDDWNTWNEDIFNEFFEKTGEQCVASLQLGYFTNVEKENIKANWSTIAPLLQELSNNQDIPNFDLYLKIQSEIRNYTNVNRKSATYRLIASLQPQLLCTIVNESKLRKLIDYINVNIEDSNLSKQGNWFEISNRVLQFFKSQLNENDAYQLLTLPWESYENFIHENRKEQILENNEMGDIETHSQCIEVLKYKKQIILQGPPGTGKTREAKLIAQQMLGLSDVELLKDHDQFKLVQFHPSYTYEDFVRGIIAESKDNHVKYTNVNKVLGEFAEKALKNFNASTIDAPESNLNEWIDEKFEDFKNNIQAKLPEEETKLSGDTITIFEVKDDHFKYAKNWQTPGYLKFSEFKNLIRAIVQHEIEVTTPVSNLDKGKFLHAHYRFTYYNALLTHFFSIYQYEEKKKEIIDTKNYVLLIDEINRANLSSVLGELIYALEYRGEAVASMYTVENSILSDKNKLILPPNLYIIGTMNTADRSVGHIDYAIRRRFAFVDIPPEKLEETDKFYFNNQGFEAVEKLFNRDVLSNEFEVKDVQIGHSYFIVKKEDAPDTVTRDSIFSMKMQYEVKPILREYLKDGIFIDGKQVEGKDIRTYIEELGIHNGN